MSIDTGRESTIWKFGNLVMWKSQLRIPTSPNSQISKFSNYQLLLRRGRIESLDDLVGDVQARMHVGGARVGDAEHRVEALLFRDLLDDRNQLLLELALQL